MMVKFKKDYEVEYGMEGNYIRFKAGYSYEVNDGYVVYRKGVEIKMDEEDKLEYLEV